MRGNPRPKLEGTVTGALNYQQAHTKFLPIRCYTPAQPSDVHAKLYPHRGTMGRGGGGIGVDGSSPYFDFAFSGKPLTLILYKMKYILCAVALLNITKHGNHLAFFQELEIT